MGRGLDAGAQKPFTAEVAEHAEPEGFSAVGSTLDCRLLPCARVAVLRVTPMKIRISIPTDLPLAIAPDRF
jgi:hypothetical protein